MTKYFNPALHEEPRNQMTSVIPLKQDESLINWLQSTGRLVPRWSYEEYYEEQMEEEDVTEITDTVISDEFLEEEEEIEILRINCFKCQKRNN
jgi:Protein of unknown function (DUF3134)